jgi:hypothetical protein
MRQTAIMDFLADGRGGAAVWAPTSERVLQTAELSGGGDCGVAAATASLSQFLAAPAAPDSLPSVPAFDQFSARRSGLGPAATEVVRTTGPPALTADDLDALEDLTYAELAAARGVDPAAVERLTGVRLGRPPARPGLGPPPPHLPNEPATAPPAPALTQPGPVGAPPPPAAPAPDALPTWPPPGHMAPAGHHPLRPRSRWAGLRRGSFRRRRRALGAIALLAVAAAAAWYFLLRPGAPSTPSAWDSRVVPTVAFVAHQERLAWKHPVRVVFLPKSEYQARFGETLASAQSRPGPAGRDVAEYVASGPVVYVNGASLDFYARYALVGQLTEALRAQYPGSASAALVRANAIRVQSAYLSDLSAAQVRALRAEQARDA